MSSIKFKVVMILNYYSHHQSELSEALYRETGGSFCFIETEPMELERQQMGWGGIHLPCFVKQSYTSGSDHKECLEICNEAGVVIIGSAPDIFIKERLKHNKLTFRYHERFFKEGRWHIFDPRVFLSHLKRDFNNRNKNLFMLCAGAYTAPDCRFIHCYKNKTFKWGYFPKVKEYGDINALIERKRKLSILWVARFIKWKHPEIPLVIAKKLKNEGYDFKLNMIGNGELENKIKEEIVKRDLQDCVHLLGTMSPDEVRRNMEESQIFLFTSDRNEGWGAVLNESMNSGCAVIANDEIGSVPYLIKDGENGLTYRHGNVNQLYQKLRFLLDHPVESSRLGSGAYQTLITTWNADFAAKRLIELIEILEQGERPTYFSGPCSVD